MDWLQKRYPGKTKPWYLHYPSVLSRKNELREVFLNFDEDGGESLDLDEFLKMFIDNFLQNTYTKYSEVKSLSDHARKEIEIEFLSFFKEIYKKVTTKNTLGLEDFIKLTFDPEVSKMFSDFMHEYLESDQAKKFDISFLPMSFEYMIDF